MKFKRGHRVRYIGGRIPATVVSIDDTAKRANIRYDNETYEVEDDWYYEDELVFYEKEMHPGDIFSSDSMDMVRVVGFGDDNILWEYIGTHGTHMTSKDNFLTNFPNKTTCGLKAESE
ncbi:hypothetical protein [Streptomyces griseosporeus]|uniref:hypothetical protein n=1 Tax=Streptomyces griseosporeus TaxID=1910 RepID=UPI00167EBDC9|nr:hypothetical protein [Streptomyces griseosporeus]GHF92312.1 hypothetical protein GCM10018783_74000 [Streptomyces griseosporeus]